MLLQPELVALPIEIDGAKKISVRTWTELKNEGYLYAAKWFRNAENIWNVLRTEKNKVNGASEYLNWNKKLSEQNLTVKYLVLYNASAKDANAALLVRKDYDLEFIVESKAYWFGTDSIKEANYLLCLLNSTVANELIKSFQSRGLFGARDVHKKILDVPFPKFDMKNKKHIALSALGEKCHVKAAAFAHTITGQIKGLSLGKARLQIRDNLKGELEEIDTLVKELIL